jgi:hypothetical protein
MLSREYSLEIKNKIISEFVLLHSRLPTDAEYAILETQLLNTYASIDNSGFSEVDIESVKYREVSSATKENANRTSMLQDMRALYGRLNSLAIDVENSFRGFKNQSIKLDKDLELLESKANNLLLMNSSVDVFVNGIEETFSNTDKVIFEDSDADVVSGYCTMKRNGNNLIDLASAAIKSSVVSNNTLLGQNNSVSLEKIKLDDGNFWELAVYSREAQGRVSLVIEIDLLSKKYVGDIKLNLSPINTNSKTVITFAYSIDGKNYAVLPNAEAVVNKNSVIASVGIADIQKLRIILAKDSADDVSSNSLQNVYLFSIDNISIYTDGYTENKKQQIVLGPYEVIDYSGNPVTFTKATLSACAQIPESTSVDFYLSQDAVLWKAIDPFGKGSNIVVFGNSSSELNKSRIDVTVNENRLVENSEHLVFAKEAFINKCIDLDLGEVSRYSFEIKRNTGLTSYGLGRGWDYDRNRNTYTTTVYVENLEGQYINLGKSSILLNNRKVNGRVFLPNGYNTVVTSSTNWKEIPAGLLSEVELRQNDSLYPYNHKYLFEGYNYANTFKGDFIYTGFRNTFSYLMQYVSPEKFNLIEVNSEHSKKFYTVEYIDNYLYVKVLVDKTNSKWLDEEFSFVWNTNANLASSVYLKAVLSTSSPTKTPIIEDFMIRTI